MRANRKTWLLVIAVAAILLFNAIVITSEARQPNPLAVAYAALVAFVGSYSPLDGQPGQPTPWMAGGLTAALLATFSAAGGALLQASRTSLARFAQTRVRKGIVVIGSSNEAEAIARSVDGVDRKLLIRLTEEETDSVLRDRSSKRALSDARHIVVAGSTDSASARIAASVQGLGEARFRLVRSAALADALRPTVLRSWPTTEAFHPGDNVGQVVARVISSLGDGSAQISATAGRAGSSPLRVAVLTYGNSPIVGTITSWLRNSGEAAKFTGDAAFELVNPDEEADIHVLAGEYEQVAAEAALRSGAASTQVLLAIVTADLQRSVAIADNSSLYSYSDWERGAELTRGDVLVVDPEQDGLNYHLIVEGMGSQWGRAYDQAYNRLYASHHPGATETRWNPEEHGKNEQSSIAAAKHMLTALTENSYALRKGRAGWIDGPPTPAAVERMARREHEAWLIRTWSDVNGQRLFVSQSSAKAIEFEALDAETRAYNSDVVLKVYPALAAMFGYGIARS